MKKKLMAIMMALAVLCTALAVQVMPVAAEVTDADLRAWFNFDKDENYFLERNNQFFDLVYGAESPGINGVFGSDVEVVEGLNGDALKFAGTEANVDAMATLGCTSAFYIRSDVDLFAGDNVTINIVYKEDTTGQVQSILYAGLSPVEFMAVKTSSSPESVGAQLAINDSGAFDEQKVSAPDSTVPTAGSWNMLTIVQEGTTYNIYMNGELVATENMTWKMGDISTTSGGKYLYALGAPSPYNDLSKWMTGANIVEPGFKGLVDDFRVYGAALSETEIQELATSLLAGDDEGTGDEGSGDEGNDEGDTTPSGSVVIDWDFSNADSIADVVLGTGVTVESGKAVFAAGNQGIALPDDIFAGEEPVTIEMVMQPSKLEANYRALLCVGDQPGKWVVMGIMKDGSVRYAIATNGNDDSQAKGNSVSNEGGWTEGVVGSDIVLTTDKEYAVKYVITQAETKVYVDDELALTVPTPDKDAIGDLGGPVNLGKATKWTADPSFEGTISSFKVTLGTVSEDDGSGSEEGDGSEDGSGEPTIITTASGNFVDADSNAEGLNMTDNNSANVGASYDGAWLGFEDVDFGEAETKTVEIVYVNNPARCKPDAALEIWIGGKNADEGGVKVGTVALAPTSENNDWFAQGTATATLDTAITGVQDVYFVMTGSEGENPYIANLFTYKFYGEVADGEGSGDEGSGNEGTGNEGTGNEGTGNEGTGNEGSGAEDNDTNKPSTGDVAMLTSILAAGVAGLGGLKLRKKSK